MQIFKNCKTMAKAVGGMHTQNSTIIVPDTRAPPLRHSQVKRHLFLLTRFLVLSLRNGLMSVYRAWMYQGWLTKWTPPKRAGKLSWEGNTKTARTSVTDTPGGGDSNAGDSLLLQQKPPLPGKERRQTLSSSPGLLHSSSSSSSHSTAYKLYGGSVLVFPKGND